MGSTWRSHTFLPGHPKLSWETSTKDICKEKHLPMVSTSWRRSGHWPKSGASEPYRSSTRLCQLYQTVGLIFPSNVRPGQMTRSVSDLVRESTAWQLLELEGREERCCPTHLSSSHFICVIGYEYQNNMNWGFVVYQQLLEQSLHSFQRWTNYKQPSNWTYTPHSPRYSSRQNCKELWINSKKPYADQACKQSEFKAPLTLSNTDISYSRRHKDLSILMWLSLILAGL